MFGCGGTGTALTSGGTGGSGGATTASTGNGGNIGTGGAGTTTGTGGNIGTGGAGGSTTSNSGTGGNIGTGGAGGSGSTGAATGGAMGSGGAGGTGSTSSGSGGAPVCVPQSTEPCYSGPAATLDVGACKAGTRTCAADGSGFGPCIGEVVPTAETCATAEDDDCDGMVNEEGDGCACIPGTMMPCYTGPAATENVGACKGGMAECNDLGTAYGPCMGEVLPSPETCNTAIDDDCDGQVNEEGLGCACVPGSTAPCYTGPQGTQNVGACKGGTATCNAQGTAYGSCVGEVLPSPETCNTAIDDDCDGQVNEEGAGCVCVPGTTQSCYSGPAGTQNVGVCKGGVATCNAQGTAYGACVGEVLPSPETCTNAVDDDCDGQVNEEGVGCVCIPGTTQACYSGPAGTQNVGVCKGGVATCNAQGTAFGACMGEVLPSPETCNTAVDDDCDGQVNEEGAGCVCVPGSTQSCYSGPAGTQNVGACKSGVATCNAQGTAYGSCVGEVLPTTETCSTAVDDDCDGQVNEGCVCVPGTTQSCYSGPAGTAGIGACKSGIRTCNAQGSAYGSCVGEVLPATETCSNAIDDDCDGQVNEGCAALTCSLYQENFDDGNAGEVTAGPYLIDWCDTYLPITQNTPLCMTGRTLRTNDSTLDPTIWIHKGTASCTQVQITYTYYQFALSNVNVTYQQSNDAAPVCEKTGTFTSLASHVPLDACTQQTVTIPFGNAAGVYVRFDHGTGTNALWIDDLSVKLLGCDC
ncbi:Tryptophan synthase alpha chain [Minicystis rosea]|nr:Tryptophan synthase alpha chain [Minicystis rosea]